MKNIKKFVVLEHLLMPDKGLRFYSTNTDNNTHSFEGELWYKEVGFVDTAEEALAIIKKQTYPTMDEMNKHFGLYPYN
jgi:hypothetical protein